MPPTRHSMSEMHRSTDDTTGANITSGYVPIAQGDGTVAWGAATGANAELNIEGGQSVINARGTLGPTEAVDPTDGNIVTGTLDQDCTITLSAPTGSGGATLEFWITQDGTGGWDVTFAATAGTVTDDGTITPDTTAGVTVRYILERTPGTTNDWVRNIVGGTAVTFGTPAIVLGTSAAAGSTDEAIRRDATIVAFDATVPVTQAFSDAAATGSAAVAARRDHVHGMPASPAATTYYEVLLTEDGSEPITTEDGLDWLYVEVSI